MKCKALSFATFLLCPVSSSGSKCSPHHFAVRTPQFTCPCQQEGSTYRDGKYAFACINLKVVGEETER